MSFLYPRTISFTRPNEQGGVGLQPYSGLNPDNETPVANAQTLSCSIQWASTKANPTGNPSDVPMTTYKVLIPGLPAGVVLDRDIGTDDLGRRLQVQSAYADSKGANFYCVLLEG